MNFGVFPRLRGFRISEASLLFRRRREETRSTRGRRPRSVRGGPFFGAVGTRVAEKPVDVLPALLDLSRWLRRDRIPFAIIGGTAVGFVGRPRTTKDVDAVALLGEHTWESFAARAAEMGFLPRSPDVVAFARQTRVFLLRHALSGVEIDISAGALPFEKESIRRAHLVSIEGTKVPMASPEDLIVMKILASRPRDLGDIEGILATNPKLDRRRVRRLVRQFSAVLEMPELNERLRALLSGRRRR